MTARHLIIGVMQRINARCHLHLSTLLGLDPATVFRLYHGENDGVRMRTIDAGRCTMPQLDSDSALLALVAPLQGKRPAWRVIDYRLQVLRKRGELTYAGKAWARAGKYGSN